MVARSLTCWASAWKSDISRNVSVRHNNPVFTLPPASERRPAVSFARIGGRSMANSDARRVLFRIVVKLQGVLRCGRAEQETGHSCRTSECASTGRQRNKSPKEPLPARRDASATHRGGSPRVGSFSRSAVATRFESNRASRDRHARKRLIRDGAHRPSIMRALGLGSPACSEGSDRTGGRQDREGKHPVGLLREHCGPLGKQDNCRVACR
jgi:hypothetical protein